MLFRLTLLLFIASGCSSCPRAVPIAPPGDALELAADETFARGNLPCNWWALFQDPQLDKLICTAFQRNPTLQSARANIALAAANANRIRSTLFPYVTWGADVSTQKLSETGLIPFNLNSNPTAANTPTAIPAGFNGIPVYFTQTETEFTLTYSFDVWGKNRNALRAAIGETWATVADEAFSRLELGVAVAQVYYQLQIDYQREEIAKAFVVNQEEYQKLTLMRMNDNLDNEISLNISKVNLASAEQSLLQIQADIAVKEHQLKTFLAGDFTECFDTIAMMPMPSIPLPKDLPLHLIANRPDIASQLWIIESAGRQIEVAKAGFYPDFNLAALFGFQTIHILELFKWPSAYYNVDPAVTLPIFNGGLLKANLRFSEVNYNLAIYKYNELVLNAAREVLDAISLLTNFDKQLDEAAKRREHQEKLLQLMEMRVENHLNSNLDYLISKQNVLTAKDQEFMIVGNSIQAALSLVKALGGGYNAL